MSYKFKIIEMYDITKPETMIESELNDIEGLKGEELLVKKLGEKIGYGNLMTIASKLWKVDLFINGYPESGAFIPVCEYQVKKRYYIDCDNSGHYYLVPVNKKEEFKVWSNLDDEDEASWEAPAWVIDINGCPSQVTFTNPEIA